MRAESQNNEVFEKLRLYFSEKPGVKEAIVFGSFAGGSNTARSDIDLIAVYDTNKRFLDRYDDFDELNSMFSFPVDILPYTEREWEDVKERKFFKNAMKKVIFEKA